MFTLLKLIPNLLGAKVEIKFLYFDQIESEIKTTSYDQAIIEKLSPNFEIKRLDVTLSNCFIGIKRVPGIQYYGHVVMVEHLRVKKKDIQMSNGSLNAQWLLEKRFSSVSGCLPKVNIQIKLMMTMMIGMYHLQPQPNKDFQLGWKRIQHLILHPLQVLLRSNVTCNALLILQVLDQNLLHRHPQRGHNFESHQVFTSSQKLSALNNWTSYHFLIIDTTNLPSKKVNSSNSKDTSPLQLNNFPLEQNTPSLAATFHQWHVVWSITRTEELSSWASKITD